MMRWRCASESDTARAARTGEWPDGLRTHAEDCPVCRDVALIATALDRDRRQSPTDLPPASAGRIWWVAQLRARHAAAERALRPIWVMTLVAIAAMATVTAGALASVLPIIASWLDELVVVPAVAEIVVRGTLPGAAVAGSAALAVLLLVIMRVVTGTGR